MDNNIYDIINSSLIITSITILSSIIIKHITNRKSIERENCRVELYDFYLPIFSFLEPIMFKKITSKEKESIISFIENQIKDKKIHPYLDSNFLIIFDDFKNLNKDSHYNDLCKYILTKYNSLKKTLLLPRIKKNYTKHFYKNYFYSFAADSIIDIFAMTLIILIYSLIIFYLIIKIKWGYICKKKSNDTKVMWGYLF